MILQAQKDAPGAFTVWPGRFLKIHISDILAPLGDTKNKILYCICRRIGHYMVLELLVRCFNTD